MIRPKYYFQFPIVTSPMDSIYNIGDQITFEISYSDTLTETKTGEKIYLPNFDFRPEMRIRTTHESPFKDATSSFLVRTETGNVTRVSLGSGLFTSPITLTSLNGRKIARFSIIPQQSGIFSFSVVTYYGDFETDNWRGTTIKGVCEREEFRTRYVNVDSTNTNYFYIQRSPDATTRSISEYIAKSCGYFCFRVR